MYNERNTSSIRMKRTIKTIIESILLEYKEKYVIIFVRGTIFIHGTIFIYGTSFIHGTKQCIRTLKMYQAYTNKDTGNEEPETIQ